MALVLEIACRSKPNLEIAPTFSELSRRGRATGLNRLTWLVGHNRTAAISVEEPVPAIRANLQERLAESAPEAAWLVRIVVSRDDADLARLARVVARQTAQLFEGAAYDGSLRRLLWPRRPRAAAALPHFPSLEEAVCLIRRDSDRADRQLAALSELVAARRADGRQFLEELAAADGTRVAVWALSCGSWVLREDFVDVLARYLSDPRMYVWESALSDLQDLAPDRILPHLPAYREKLRRARPEYEPASHLLWLFAQMNDKAAYPAVARFRDRLEPGRPFVHRLATVVAEYLWAGPGGVLPFLMDLDGDYLCAAARVAARLGTAEALAALRFAASSATNRYDRDLCREEGDSLEHALETLSPPFWRGFTGEILTHHVFT